MKQPISSRPADSVEVKPTQDAGGGFASRRFYRILSVSLASTTLLLLGSNLSVMTAQTAVLPLAFVVTALVVLCVPSVAVLVLCFFVGRRVLRPIWGTVALAMLVIDISLPFVISSNTIPADMQLTWIGELSVVAGIASILAWPPERSVVYALVLGVVLFSVAVICGDGGVRSTAAGAAMRLTFFTIMFMCLAGVLLRAGRTLDDTVDQAVAEARSSAEREALRSSRRSIRMLVHDSIIVALLSYAKGAARSQSAAQARHALDAIENGPVRADDDRTPSEIARLLRGLTTDLDPQAHFDASVEDGDPYPRETARSLIDACAEALRNSIRHAEVAGPVAREVHAFLAADSAEVVVLDDGIGFDPEAVPRARLGIRFGILDRMHAVEGGSAEVMSRMGYGTTVVLRWERA